MQMKSDQALFNELLKKGLRQPNGCLICHLGPAKNGYPYVSRGRGKRLKVSRFILQFLGRLTLGEWALHKCDEKSCIEPEHLFSGTAKDNSEDMVVKDRVARFGRPPIPIHLLKEAKQLREQGWSYPRIARHQGLAGGTSAADRVRRANALAL